MTRYLHARLTRPAEQMIRKDYGSVSKTSIRKALRAKPNLEFTSISTPDQPRHGAYLTTSEASREGFDVIEVRYNNDHDVAMITLHPSGGVIVS